MQPTIRPKICRQKHPDQRYYCKAKPDSRHNREEEGYAEKVLCVVSCVSVRRSHLKCPPIFAQHRTPSSSWLAATSKRTSAFVLFPALDPGAHDRHQSFSARSARVSSFPAYSTSSCSSWSSTSSQNFIWRSYKAHFNACDPFQNRPIQAA